MTQTTEGTGPGSVERIFPKIINDVVKTENLTPKLNDMVFNVPQNNVGDNNYTLQLTDAGKHIYATDCTITIPYYYDVDFHVGTKIMIVTGPDSVVIARDGVSMSVYAPDSNYGSYVVASRNVVTLLMTNDDEWYLFGNGITDND